MRVWMGRNYKWPIFSGRGYRERTLSRRRLQGTSLTGAQLQGALLGEAELQGAYLGRAQLQGVVDIEDPPVGFVASMRNGIGRESDFSDVIFAGGLEPEELDSLVEDLSDEKAERLREKLEPHIDQPKSNELPVNSGVVTGAYAKEEAERWIAEYEKFMGKTTGVSDN